MINKSVAMVMYEVCRLGEEGVVVGRRGGGGEKWAKSEWYLLDGLTLMVGELSLCGEKREPMEESVFFLLSPMFSLQKSAVRQFI